MREVSEMLEERQKRKAEESILIREFPEPEITQNLTKEVKISQIVPAPVCKNETQGNCELRTKNEFKSVNLIQKLKKFLLNIIINSNF